VPPLNLDTAIVGSHLLTFDELDSTNTFALRHGTDGMVIVADSQTAGRGRYGRAWHSAPGLGLWFSVALEGHDAAEGLAFGAALAVREALRTGCHPEIKWPNDLLVHGKKVCGILVERRHGRTALGIGINVHHRPEDFPEPLREKAASLETATGTAWNRAEVLRAVLTHLDRQVMLLRSGKYEAVRRAWADACNLTGRRVRCGGLVGTVAGVDGRGALLLDTYRGVQRLVSGEIALVEGV